MSVRISGSGQAYSSTANLPSIDGFSVTCWMYMTTDRNAISGLLALQGLTSLRFETTSDGTNLQIWPTGGQGGTSLLTVSTGQWYRIGISSNSTSTGNFYSATATGSVSTTAFSKTAYAVLTSVSIGVGLNAADWWNGRLANFKMWNNQLTLAEMYKEWGSYVPQRTADLARWYPWVNAETTDYSGMGSTLSGGSGATTEVGPPVAWRRHRYMYVPWDPSTPLWYAVYVIATGELWSLSTTDPGTPPADKAYKTYLTQPDLTAFVWDTTVLDFVAIEGSIYIDRVADLAADGTLASAWSALDATQTTAMKSRIGQMLGPYRYRLPDAEVDLQVGFGA